MSTDPAEAFLVSLGHAQLLDASQLQEMRSWIAEFQPDPTALAKELIRRGWSETDLEKLAGGNTLRVLAAVEAAAG